jgi:hypothetical protein
MVLVCQYASTKVNLGFVLVELIACFMVPLNNNCDETLYPQGVAGSTLKDLLITGLQACSKCPSITWPWQQQLGVRSSRIN